MKIEAPQVQAQILGGGSYPGYRCPITGEFVTSRKRRRDIMAEHNVIEAGDTSSAQRERKARVLESTNGTGTSE